jgi:hypothetical protein
VTRLVEPSRDLVAGVGAHEVEGRSHDTNAFSST